MQTIAINRGSKVEISEYVFSKDVFTSYIKGNHDSDTRSLVRSTWRRAPLINHNYDVSGAPFAFAPDSKVMIVWDLVLWICVGWSLIVAPLEFGLKHAVPVLEVVDFIVCCAFMVDVGMNFLVAVESEERGGIHQFNYDRKVIGRQYLRGWFLFDVVCALPLDAFRPRWTHGSFQTPLRLVRLVRLFSAMKLQRTNLVSRIDLPYTVITVVRCLMLSLTCGHWISCLWASLQLMQPGHRTWVDAVKQNKLDVGEDISDEPLTVYIWSFYYSVSLITTVGFGDVTPQTDLECIVSVISIVLGSSLWAFILSSLLDVLYRMDPHRLDFEESVDELNRMMSEHGLPDSLRHDVRHYFFECQDLWKLQRRGELISRMSKPLKGRVTLALCGEWVEKVVYIRELFVRGIPGSTAFVVDLARKLMPKIFSPGERFPSAVMYVVRKGLVSAGFRLLAIGDVCGEDMLLQNPANRMQFHFIALTTAGTLALARSDLVAVLGRFPKQRETIRRYTCWLALKRGMSRELVKLAKQLHGEPSIRKAIFGATVRSKNSMFRSLSQRSPRSPRSQGGEDEEPEELLEIKEEPVTQLATAEDLQKAVSAVEARFKEQRKELASLLFGGGGRNSGLGSSSMSVFAGRKQFSPGEEPAKPLPRSIDEERSPKAQPSASARASGGRRKSAFGHAPRF